MYSLFILQPPKALSNLLGTRIFARLMGGGPRTFPGGINKWQWKRLHEKRAKEKEKRLLDQEKQLYEARIRCQIRAKLAGGPNPEPNPNGHNPMSPRDHIKALADRFMVSGAEDLWNEKDGPLESPQTPRKSNQRSGSLGSGQRAGLISCPSDLRKLVSVEGRNVNVKVRYYSVVGGSDFGTKSNLVKKDTKFRRNASSSNSDDSKNLFGHGAEKHFRSNLVGKPRNESNSKKMIGSIEKRGFNYPKMRRFWKNESSSTDSDDDEEEKFDSDDDMMESGRRLRNVGSSAALGEYDLKRTKRVPLKELEDIDFSEEVEFIRNELEKKKKLTGNDGDNGEVGEGEWLLSNKRFDECDISPLTVKALTEAGYVQMTRVQGATLSVCLEGKDALVKAKTGTGKSAAFLLPAIESVLKATSSDTNPRVNPVYVLILCPTRELASQIAAQAIAMLKYHNGIGVQTLVGGTRFKVDKKRLESDPCQMIIATPGRLLDHIENRGGLSVHLMALKMLILDEADHLLDLGFRKDVEKIVDCLPRRRQSLLFSATIPKEVRRISQLVLKREHAFIDTVGLDCVETPEKVKQSFLVIQHELHFQVVHHLLEEHIKHTSDYKVIVFCSSGMVTSLFYLLLREMKMNVREMHSRKPQLYRTRVSDEFRESKRLVLITSDVSSRGMNYPDVTLVIQVGIPSTREQYIHRLGRTGREGKDGEGILLLAPWEGYFLDELKDLPLEKVPLPHLEEKSKLKIDNSLSKIDSSIKEAAYHAWLGYYNSIRKIGRDKTTLVELAKRFCDSIGLQQSPPLFRRTALKMGLKGIPDLKAPEVSSIHERWSDHETRRGWLQRLHIFHPSY
ncbi:hypothetical protein K2173_021713 [Erythroxylum novogranatense]|uniref:ATP-dependent RNA helicase n=1 Tax=Erythroxylum novogranatense TaxID=1862640 RepID=A0AAV8TH44_9ROSI|nr:hypothetical protein K2173_021713 [Erythroxylum novogranatense]